MARIMIAPGRYIQGYGELTHLERHVAHLGSRFCVLVSKGGLARLGEKIKASFAGTSSSVTLEVFGGECSTSEVERLRGLVRAHDCDVVVGVGGGKALDTAKAVAYYEKTPVVIVPTVAATDAPCSALSVIYTDDGAFSKYLVLPSNPNVVLMDTEIISKAPVRLLVSGMGDALATFFEARACVRADKLNMSGGHATRAGYALAKLCYSVLLENGVKAARAVECQVCTPAVENIVEANTYLSGLGFESVGLAAAHAVHNGFTTQSACHHLYHGEKVAFGTLVQLVLEGASSKELDEVLMFLASVELPMTLADLGMENATREQIMMVAEATCAPGETIHNMPFQVTAQSVFDAIWAADALGRAFKR